VKHLSLGLIALGLQCGDKISIIGDNDPRWFWAELATQAARGIPTGIVSDCSTLEVKHIVEHSDSRFVVVQDQEQIDKMLQIKDDLPLVKKVIYWDAKGIRHYHDPILMSFEQVLKLGQEYETTHPGLFEQNVAQGKGDDTGLLLYTSGTTGLPKGAMISYDAFISSNLATIAQNPVYATDNFVSFTLPGWTGEQGLGLLPALIVGQILNFPETMETVPDNILEIAPQTLLYGSRLWEGVASTTRRKISDAPLLNRLIYRLLLAVGYRVADLKAQGKTPNLFWRTFYGLANVMAFRPLKSRLGLHKVRIAYTGGSALGPDVIKFFSAIGVNIRQVFGLTETEMISVETSENVKMGSVGKLVPGVILRLSEAGEILVKGDCLFQGYYKAPEATERIFEGGWLHTGDAGHIDDEGFLFFIDRLEDMRQLADGTRFSPQYIESRLRFSSYIQDAFALGGEERDFVGAVISIDFDNVGKWAERRHIPYTTFVDLSQKPEACELIREEIEKVNKLLPHESRIKRFVNLHKAFDPDEAELTRTMKLRRAFVEDRYSELVDAVYGEREELVMEAAVVYRDGRKGLVSTKIRVNRVD
jgi:long-chain acyl-CoA synthetase